MDEPYSTVDEAQAASPSKQKLCTECGELKLIAEFSKKDRQKYRSYCKECDNHSRREERRERSTRYLVCEQPVEIVVEHEQIGQWTVALLSLLKERGMIGIREVTEEHIDVDSLLKRQSAIAELLKFPRGQARAASHLSLG